jgi:hypothetical protein
MYQYHNGNSIVNLFDDGTRVIHYEDELNLEFPLNIDIRVSTKCSFGYNPKTNKAFCDFCHESARTDGDECNYNELKGKLIGLPKGIELAIGANNLTVELFDFIHWCDTHDYIVNLTINQGHLKRDSDRIKSLINNQLIKGLGISYRSSLNWDVPRFILEYEHTVFHVIAGIDSIYEIMDLSIRGVKKVLVLGEKDFGFNYGKVDLTTKKHKEWFWFISKLFRIFDIVSFDNLALEQMDIKRFFNDESWNVFNQGEHSFYINAVDEYFAPSSRSNDKTNWSNVSVDEYFKLIDKNVRRD